MRTNLTEALEGQNRLKHIFKIAQAVAYLDLMVTFSHKIGA